MIGVGTKEADLEQCRSSFCSILGRDNESWGLSYFGTFHHNGKSREYTTKFDQGTTIGVHLDTWSGKLAFLKDGKHLGVVAEGLRGKDLYPMVSSTAARTKMRLMRSTSVGFSLQYLCCAEIGKLLPDTSDIKALPIPPGVKQFLRRELDWIFKVHAKPRQDTSRDAKRKRTC
jgi:SPRY domain-containing SOCS box protein 3